MPKYVEGMIVDRDHVICPDGRLRMWYSSSRDPFGYERTLGLEYGRIKLSGGPSAPGWRKDSDGKFILHKGKVKERLFTLQTVETWLASQKSEDELQVIAKRRREKIQAVKEYEAIAPIDTKGMLTRPDYSFQDKDPLPLPY